MITFETQEDFEAAVMAVLRERLNLNVYVTTEVSDDYYCNDYVPKVEVSLLDSYDYTTFATAEGKA